MAASKKNTVFETATPLGILGGGQLARMMVLAGFPLGLDIHVLSESEKDPAAQVTRHWQKGSPNDPDDVKTFLSRVKIATFESEFLDAELLAEAAEQTGCRISPSPALMGRLQDRLTQKELLDLHGLPTAPYMRVDSADDLRAAFSRFKKMVVKSRRYGYDGYGTFVVKTAGDFSRFSEAEFISHGRHGWIAEEFIPFDREMAMIAARNRSGEVRLFPLVETFQRNSRCLWVRGPVRDKQKTLTEKIRRFLQAVDYVGVMGIEFFQKNGRLIVNELAPRVHNSGHYSQDAMPESQFVYHLKSILNYPLPEPRLSARGFAMVNLLGDGHKKPCWETASLNGGQIHWYGKEESREGRKMGHLNFTAATPQAALKEALRTRKKFYI